MTDHDADLYRAAHQREKNSHEEWIEAVFEEAGILHRKRHEIGSDPAFGEWLRVNKVNDLHSKDDRAALIAMGGEPEALRACLTVTKRNSLQHIHRHEFAQFRHLTKLSKPDSKETHTMSRKDKAVSQHAQTIAWLDQRGEQGATCGEAEQEFNVLHQSMSRIFVNGKADGTLVPTGEKRVTPNGGKAEVLVLRKYATPEMRRPTKVKTKGNGKKVSVPINRGAVPLLRIGPDLPDEISGYPTPDTAQEPDPERPGLTRAQGFVYKWGHGGRATSLERKIAARRHQVAVKLASLLHDLKDAMATFQRTPQPQADALVPMDPVEFIAHVHEHSGGPLLRKKVETALTELEPVEQWVTHYLTSLRAALAALPPVDAATMAAVTAEGEAATKH